MSPRIRSTFRSFIPCSLLGCAVISCGLEADDSASPPVAESEQPLYYLTAKLWAQRDIPVCWHNQSGPSFVTEKNWVRAALAGKRSWSSAGNIDFTGWSQGCDSTPTGIKISVGEGLGAMTFYLSNPASGVAEMLLDFGPNVTTTYPICSNQGLSREQCIKVIALHEFGHAIGLAHEHNRPDTPEWCTESPQGTNGDQTFGPWDNNSIMSYCSSVKDLSGLERRGIDRIYGQFYGDSPRHRDINADGKADLLCGDVRNGSLWVDYADASGTFGGTNWSKGGDWCNQPTKRLFKGDFNADGRVDLLCHDAKFGNKQRDLADTSGRYGGSDWTTSAQWCNHETGRMMIGDFNNDNRDDLLCRDVVDGRLWIDYASSSATFGGTDWTAPGIGCTGTGRQFMGDLNGDGRDDLVCHYPLGLSHLGSGFTRSLADSAGRFGATTFVGSSFCTEPSNELYVGYFNGDNRLDVMCHDVESGQKWFMYTGTGGTFGGSGTWEYTDGWCSFVGSRVSVGDFNGDGRDDLLCFDAFYGTKYIARANADGTFFTNPDWSTTLNWCGHDSGELH